LENDYGGKLSEPACRKTLKKHCMIKNICMISKNYLYHIPYFIFIEKRETGREGRRGWEADEIFGVFGEVKGV
jgi:hypothetical protein